MKIWNVHVQSEHAWLYISWCNEELNTGGKGYFICLPVDLPSLENLCRLFMKLLNPVYRRMDGIRPVARPLPTHQSLTQKDDDKHSCFKRDSKPWTQYPRGQDLRPRNRDHCDQNVRDTTAILLRTSRAAHLARIGEIRNAYIILVWKNEGK
jgi:hypothetical protein